MKKVYVLYMYSVWCLCIVQGICGVDVVNIWCGVCVVHVCGDVYGVFVHEQYL